MSSIVTLRLLAACYICQWITAFNLDTRIPIVKIGSPQSHFGYSVAQHQTVQHTIANRKRTVSWMLVGAPKDHNLQPGTQRSGALWKCPFSTRTDDCEQVHTDGYKDPVSGLYKFKYNHGNLLPPEPDEIKDGQWLGGTVRSQGPGGDVLVCAHRYIHKGKSNNFQWGFGMCYLLDQNLDLVDTMEPCRGKTVDKGHEQWGFCQAGMSGMILEDEVLLGVPGPYTWRGTVHTSNISENYLFRDKTKYFGPVTQELSPVDKYSYLGYSVTSGRLVGSHLSYVGGAPRSNGSGQVVFFSRERLRESQLLVDLILDGEMFASSFGFELLTVDINNDGSDDLVVSAPFYFTSHSSGAIYIYINDGNGITRNQKFTRIEGAKGETRFGFSLANLGDINRDGFNDIAVGAPYEGKGVIYIYLGSESGLITKPSQIIRASDLPGPSYDAFGYALSGGLDMDGNGYPDLLTSSFCSDRVVLLRSRPIIAIKTSVLPDGGPRNIDSTTKSCQGDMMHSQLTCFFFETCFRMDHDKGTQANIGLSYKIEELFYNDNRFNRVSFVKDGEYVPGKIQRRVQLSSGLESSKYQCNKEFVYINANNRDVLRPIKFKLSYEILHKEGAKRIDDYPILDQQEAIKLFEAHFVKDCGDDICESDLHTRATLLLPWDNARSHNVLELGTSNVATLEAEVTNRGEPAYEPLLYVHHHASMALSVKDSNTSHYVCETSRSDLVKCALGNPLTNTSGPLYLSFKAAGAFESEFVYFKVFSNSTSVEISPEGPIRLPLEIVKRAEISITGFVEPEQVFYSGESLGESAVSSVKDIGAEVTHKYVVDNRGPWRVDYAEVEIMWPYQVASSEGDGKWLLYLSEVPSVDGDGECRIDPQHLNPLGLSLYRDPFYSRLGEVDGEISTSGIPPKVSPDTKSNEAGHSGSTSMNRTSTVIKTITTSTTNNIRKETSKSSSSGSGTVMTTKEKSGSQFSNTVSKSADDDDYYYYDYEDEPEVKSVKTSDSSSSSSAVSTKKVYETNDRANSNVQDKYASQGGSKYSAGSSDSRYNSVSGYGDRKSDSLGSVGFTVKEGSSGNDGYTRNVYDGGKGLEESRSESRQYTDGQGYRVTEKKHEYRNTHKSESSLPQSTSYNRQHISGGSSSGSSGSTGSYDSGIQSRTFDSGRGAEQKRSQGHAYTADDGTFVSYDRKEVKRTHTSGHSNSDFHDEGMTSDLYHNGIRPRSGPNDQEGANSYSSSRKTTYVKSSSRSSDNDIGGSSGASGFQRFKKNTAHKKHNNDYYEYYDESDPESNKIESNNGETYSQVNFDDSTGQARTYSHQVFNEPKSDNYYSNKNYGPGSDGKLRHSMFRVRREIVVKSEAYTDDQTGKTIQVVNLHCGGSSPTARCLPIRCSLRNLGVQSSANIRVKSRLWNATLVEDFAHVNLVNIQSSAALVLEDSLRLRQDQSDDEATATTKAYANLLEQSQAVPLWLILLSIFAGLLILILIITVLWKMGFFERNRRPDPTLSGNIAKNGY